MPHLVMIRPGESDWNRQNRFTGWTDVDLSAKGVQEALSAGDEMKKAGYAFDVAYTSAGDLFRSGLATDQECSGIELQ